MRSVTTFYFEIPNKNVNLIKERLNVAKHGVDFEEAKSVFADEFALVLFDEDH